MTTHEPKIIEADPLGALRDELLAAARRRTVARRRRRRVLVTGAALLGMLVVTGGAMAITNTATGVPAIDRLLDASSQPATQVVAPQSPNHPIDPLPPGVEAPTQPDVTPARGTGTSSVMELTLVDGSRVVAVGYVNPQRSLCTAIADPDAPTGRRRGAIGCLGRGRLSTALDDAPVRVISRGGIDTSGATLVQGIAAADVEGITVDGSTAALSEPWIPDGAPGAVRTFVAEVDGTGGKNFMRVDARLADGRQVEITP